MSNHISEPRAQVVIEPSPRWPRPDWHELSQYRELLYFLTWRDVKVRYKQTVLGASWAVLQPVVAMVLFTLVLKRIADPQSEGVPYAVFTYAALVPWTFVSTATTQAANSTIINERMIAKIYFPRVLLPVGAVGAAGVDLALSFTLLIGLMVVYGIAPTLAVLTLPIFVAIAFTTALAVGIGFSAVNVRYRDVRYVLPFMVQMWLFASPIAYSSSLIPDSWRFVYAINPMVGVVDGFRWAMLDAGDLDVGTVAVSGGVAVLMLVVALLIFARLETSFADEV